MIKGISIVLARYGKLHNIVASVGTNVLWTWLSQKGNKSISLYTLCNHHPQEDYCIIDNLNNRYISTNKMICVSVNARV